MESFKFIWADEHGILYYVPKTEDGEYIIELGVALRKPFDPKDQRQGEWKILIPFKAEVVADVKADMTVKSEFEKHVPSSATFKFSLYKLVPQEIADEYRQKTNDYDYIEVTVTKDEILSALFSTESPRSIYYKIHEKLSDPQKLTKNWDYGLSLVSGSEEITLQYLRNIFPIFKELMELKVGRQLDISVFVETIIRGGFFSEEDLLVNLNPRIEGSDIYLNCHVETKYTFPIYFWVAVPTDTLEGKNFRDLFSELVTTTFKSLPEVSVDISDVMFKSLEAMLGFLIYRGKRESFEGTTAPGWSVARVVERKLIEEINKKFQTAGVRWDKKIYDRYEIYYRVKEKIIDQIYNSFFGNRTAELVKGVCVATNRVEKVEISDFDPKVALIGSSPEAPSRSHMFALSEKSVEYTYEITRYNETVRTTLYFSFEDENTFRGVLGTLESLPERATDFVEFIRMFWMVYNLLLKGSLDRSKVWRWQLEDFEKTIQEYISS